MTRLLSHLPARIATWLSWAAILSVPFAYLLWKGR